MRNYRKQVCNIDILRSPDLIFLNIEVFFLLEETAINAAGLWMKSAEYSDAVFPIRF